MTATSHPAAGSPPASTPQAGDEVENASLCPSSRDSRPASGLLETTDSCRSKAKKANMEGNDLQKGDGYIFPECSEI